MVTGKNTPETVIKEKIVEKTQVIYKDRPIDAGMDVESEDEGGDGTSARKKSKSRRSRQSGSVKKETAEERKRRLMSQLDIPGAGSRSGGSGGGDSLSQQQMSRVVAKNRGSLQLCYERAMKSGAAPTDRDLKVTFNVKVGMSGMVKSLNMSGSGTAYPALKSCLSSSIKKWMFPASQGNSAVQFPIVFTPAR